MIIGDRLRALREEKKFSQGDIEKRTGLFRCYISRVENGHTVPAIETLEKLARALEVPLYQLFYDGEEPPELPNLPKRKSADDIVWGSPERKPASCTSSAVLWDVSKNPTGGWCFTWRKKWPHGSSPTRAGSLPGSLLLFSVSCGFLPDTVLGENHARFTCKLLKISPIPIQSYPAASSLCHIPLD